MKKAISFLLTAILMFSLCVSLASCDVQLDETPIETTTADTSIDLSQIPLYVQQESERVANDVESIRKDNSFVFGAISDVHTTGEDVASQGILHAGQALSYIDSLTSLDMVTLLGDVPVGYFTDDAVVSFDFVKQCFADVAKHVPFVQLQGNHDQYVSDTTEVAQQKYYDYIGANNVGTVTDSGNEFRNYGYRDFSDKKIRVIYLNTTDVSDAAVTTDYGVSNAQLTWLQNVALNLDDAEWGIIVLSHHPLNWYGMTPLLNVLDTYKGKGTGAELIAHFHGHILYRRIHRSAVRNNRGRGVCP